MLKSGIITTDLTKTARQNKQHCIIYLQMAPLQKQTCSSSSWLVWMWYGLEIKVEETFEHLKLLQYFTITS